MLRSTVSFLKNTFLDAFRLVCSPRKGLKSVYGVSLKIVGSLTVHSRQLTSLSSDSRLLTADYRLKEGSALISAATFLCQKISAKLFNKFSSLHKEEK